METIDPRYGGEVASRYARQPLQSAGAKRLAGALLAQYLTEYAQGKRILDINLGSGELAHAMARSGSQVVGVVPTQVQLDAYRQQFGDSTLKLLLGEFSQLPVADASMDSLIANCILKAEDDWPSYLAHWATKLVPGGRLIVDLPSADHRQFAANPKGDNGAIPSAFAEALVTFANHQEFEIVAAFPARGFLCGDDLNLLAAPHLDGVKRWERLLSWMSVDDALLQLGLFLEREYLSCLTTAMSPSTFVVLQKGPNAHANAQWLTRQRALNQLLFSGEVNAKAFTPYLRQPAEILCKQIEPHLASLRSRTFLYRLLRSLLPQSRITLDDFVPASTLSVLRRWGAQDAQDVAVTSVAEGWAEQASEEVREISCVLSYSLIRALMTEPSLAPGEEKA